MEKHHLIIYDISCEFALVSKVNKPISIIRRIRNPVRDRLLQFQR